RRQGIEAIGMVTEDMRMSRADRFNLVMIFAPILLILFFLLTSKEAVGCGIIGRLFGVTQVITDGVCRAENLPWAFQLVQNSAGDAGSAGWWAVALVSLLLFLDAEMRARPRKLVDALADAGILIATLYLMFLAVSIIDFCLNFTGLSGFIALDILGWLKSLDLGAGSSGFLLFVALAVTMLLAVLLGMGMPAVPAYINVALLMGPLLAGLGIANFTAHMFIFYFAVASAITPPVAIAAFAAASITKADPMRTGFSAVRSGAVMFVIPFVFAFYPELLLIEPALIAPGGAPGSVNYLPGYEGGLDVTTLVLLLARLVLALYLLASALAGFDRNTLPGWEIALRLAVAIAILAYRPEIAIAGAVLGGLLIGRQYLASSERGQRRGAG
ncbi:MAG: TRAP transporter large permease subunit, partial [Pseudomonadota bacterium]